ncbi:SHOCT domain-containing protein [Candidatus Pelagibacter bacterium]|nr:SHOCT domain-containing protein [Candidatus Pelagibacter bacterium]MDB4217139.1 SHOCT domain-containing protein [Candidatus Pelagibacter sp.]
MKKKIYLILFILLFSSQAFAAKFSHKVGDVVENEVSFGKSIKFPLPPGKFTVAVIHKSQEFRNAMLYQIDQETGYVRWAINIMATGNTQNRGWRPAEWCDRTNVYFIKIKKANNRHACWMVNHIRSDISANRGFWKKVRDYELSNKLKNPDIFVFSDHNYAKGSKLYNSMYFYNPELDGIPKPKSLQWDTNEFHLQKVMNYPKHEAFLKKYISVSASLVDRFNQLNKVKGNLTLDASTLITQASINVGSGETTKEAPKGNIVEQIKQLKELMDAGAITKEEFEKAKKQLLN